MQQPKDSRLLKTENRWQAQQLFNEKIANGTMTKEELENTPTCLRNFDEAEAAIYAKADQDFAIQTEVSSILDSVVNQVIDSSKPPLFGPRPMTIGGSSIFRDPNYDCDGNPIDTEEDYNEKDARELSTNKWDKIEFDWQIWTTPREYHELIDGYAYLPPVEDLKPPKGLKREVAEILHDEKEEKEKKSPCQCILM